MSPCHDHELTPSACAHRVQRLLSTAYTVYSIHPRLFVFPTFSNYELTPEGSFSLWRASLHDRPPSASSPWELKDQVTLSHSHGCELTNWWNESQHPARRALTTAKYLSKFPRSRPTSSDDHGLLEHLQTSSITASKFARSWPPSASRNVLDHGLQVYPETRSITASKVVQSWPPSASTILLDHGLQVYLQIPSITASNCISKLARSRPWSVSLSSLHHHCQVHLELLSSTACCQSRYIVCRWVAILIHRYIDENTNRIHEF